MKNVALFRVLIAFPLIGVAMPDAAFCLKDTDYRIPMFHFIILAILMIMLFVSYLIKGQKAGGNGNLI